MYLLQEDLNSLNLGFR